ncbi:hypothetical protein B0H11DRAFT_2159926 [Mycena galericulata]|nr:hypothetical protein B0H11DRAFT_2159926 [Mycena galericulata]
MLRASQVSCRLDEFLLAALPASTSGRRPTLRDLVHQYVEQSGYVLTSSLPYESRPARHRRPTLDDGNPVFMVAHCVQDRAGKHKVTVSSGFALAGGDASEEALVLTCAHTLEEARPRLFKRISPYPAHRDTAIRAHFVAHERPQEPGWAPWVGGTWSKWVRGTVLGYRDFSGRETHPGTYDALSHLLESGAVVGVILGTRMDNRVEGVRGWGVPSETIFEMFSLPGFHKPSLTQ